VIISCDLKFCAIELERNSSDYHVFTMCSYARDITWHHNYHVISTFVLGDLQKQIQELKSQVARLEQDNARQEGQVKKRHTNSSLIFI